jgi:hypothetical protein
MSAGTVAYVMFVLLTIYLVVLIWKALMYALSDKGKKIDVKPVVQLIAHQFTQDVNGLLVHCLDEQGESVEIRFHDATLAGAAKHGIHLPSAPESIVPGGVTPSVCSAYPPWVVIEFPAGTKVLGHMKEAVSTSFFARAEVGGKTRVLRFAPFHNDVTNLIMANNRSTTKTVHGSLGMVEVFASETADVRVYLVDADILSQLHLRDTDCPEVVPARNGSVVFPGLLFDGAICRASGNCTMEGLMCLTNVNTMQGSSGGAGLQNGGVSMMHIRAPKSNSVRNQAVSLKRIASVIAAVTDPKYAEAFSAPNAAEAKFHWKPRSPSSTPVEEGDEQSRIEADALREQAAQEQAEREQRLYDARVNGKNFVMNVAKTATAVRPVSAPYKPKSGLVWADQPPDSDQEDSAPPSPASELEGDEESKKSKSPDFVPERAVLSLAVKAVTAFRASLTDEITTEQLLELAALEKAAADAQAVLSAKLNPPKEKSEQARAQSELAAKLRAGAALDDPEIVALTEKVKALQRAAAPAVVAAGPVAPDALVLAPAVKSAEQLELAARQKELALAERALATAAPETMTLVLDELRKQKELIAKLQRKQTPSKKQPISDPEVSILRAEIGKLTKKRDAAVGAPRDVISGMLNSLQRRMTMRLAELKAETAAAPAVADSAAAVANQPEAKSKQDFPSPPALTGAPTSQKKVTFLSRARIDQI